MKLPDCVKVNRPFRIVPDDPPGCLDRLLAWLWTWAVRLLLAAMIFGMGYGCRIMVER